MYAVVVSGGKQHRVKEGDLLRVEKLNADVGAEIALDQVLLIAGEGEPKVGSPTVDGASVKAEVVIHGQSKKIIVFKRKRHKGYTRKQGHRQQYTDIRIKGIEVN
ncbi:MAG: 50S ribosomal protein L21 [Myxococcota bacterium]|nr:50S ribosomal protein L21 [Myxococcota bacterium]